MKLLLHICCAPCAIYPMDVLRQDGVSITGFFYKHNIHPYTECMKRQNTLEEYAAHINLHVIYQKGYDLEGFLRKAAFREENRCAVCYHDRLNATAGLAAHGKFDAFSTTLLYSKFQRHELIREIGESVGKTIGIPFLYQDFRLGWKTGIEESRRMGMYRQPYCGCIYSEKERYFKPDAGGMK
jgi:predicted adenine nucleotide alpha hydrolase (AANH) superfamily ATPase